MINHYTWKLVDLHKSKQGNTTNLNISFSMENEKRDAQVGLEPTTYCLLGVYINYFCYVLYITIMYTKIQVDSTSIHTHNISHTLPRSSHFMPTSIPLSPPPPSLPPSLLPSPTPPLHPSLSPFLSLSLPLSLPPSFSLSLSLSHSPSLSLSLSLSVSL